MQSIMFYTGPEKVPDFMKSSSQLGGTLLSLPEHFVVGHYNIIKYKRCVVTFKLVSIRNILLPSRADSKIGRIYCQCLILQNKPYETILLSCHLVRQEREYSRQDNS